MISEASIWMMSNNRMNREINHYLMQTNGNIFLPQYIQNIFNQNKNDLYIKKTILDFQFNNLKIIEHDASDYVIQELKKNTKLNKSYPHYSSSGILSAINTLSLLIKTGFITNEKEEKKLTSDKFQYQVVNSIVKGLKNYFYSRSMQE